MNNRIMAMLFALVAAMFISIVPVKAEAAACTNHVDADMNYLCDTVGCSEHVHHATEVPEVAATCTQDGVERHFKCVNCGHVSVYKNFRTTTTLADLAINKLGHNYEYVVTDTQHSLVCTVCEHVKSGSAQNHDKDCSANEAGGHTWTCKVEGCTWVLEENHSDADKNCVCDYCDAKLEHTAGEWKKYPSDPSKHFKQCTVCFTTLETEEHAYAYADVHENYHEPSCETCGTIEAWLAHKDTEGDGDCLCDDCGHAMPHTDTSKMTYVPAKAATCTEDGNTDYYACSDCGGAFLSDGSACDPVVKALGHQPNNKWEKDDNDVHYQWCANNCGTKMLQEEHKAGDWKLYPSDKTKHFHQCTVCYKTVELEEHDFSYVDVHETYHEPVCNVCGYKASWLPHKDAEGDGDCLCDDCGHAMPHTDTSKMTYVEAKAATCTEAGNTDYYECGECGGIFLSDGTAWDPAVEALGHDWKAKPDTLNGQHLQKCDRCSAFQTLGHEDTNGDCLCDVNGCGILVHSHKLVFVPAEEATCTEEGAEAYYKYEDCGKMFDLYQNPITAAKVIPAKGHDFGDEWIPCEGGIHAKFCANCDEFQSEEHKFLNGNVICSVCGGEEELTYVAAKAATCTDNGSVEYWASKVTGKKYADAAGTTLIADVTVPATGHNMSGWEDLGNGQGHKQVCMNAGCNHELTENHDNVNSCFCTECGGFKNGHTNELVEAVPATCAKAGTQAHFKCSCGKLYDLGYNPIEKAGSIAQLKHVMGTQVKKDAKEGKHYVQCKNCTYKMYEEHAMVLSDPLKGNYHQYLCECGELKIETHTDKNGDNKCDVCEHNMGKSTVTVEQHNSQTVITGQSDKIEPTKNWWWNWQELFTPSNSGGTAATEKPAENNASSNAPANNGTAEKAPAASGSANTGSANSGSANNGGSNVGTPTVSAPSASQTNVLVQFINWFLGLFGF